MLWMDVVILNVTDSTADIKYSWYKEEPLGIIFVLGQD